MQLTAKRYVEQLGKIKKIIAGKKKELQYWEEMKQGLTAGGLGGIRVSGTVDQQPTERAVVECDAAIEEINKAVALLRRKWQEITETLQQLPEEEYELMHNLYVIGVDLSEVGDCFEIPKSYSWVTTNKGRALKHLQEILDLRQREQASRPLQYNNLEELQYMSANEMRDFLLAVSLGLKEWCDYSCENPGDNGCDKCIEKWLQDQPKRRRGH